MLRAVWKKSGFLAVWIAGGLACALSSSTSHAETPIWIAVYNTFTVPGLHEVCEYHFKIREGVLGEPIHDLVVDLAALDQKNGFSGDIELKVPALGGDAGEWSDQEDDAQCDASHFQIVSAHAVVKGRMTDLLRANAIHHVDPVPALNVELPSADVPKQAIKP